MIFIGREQSISVRLTVSWWDFHIGSSSAARQKRKNSNAQWKTEKITSRRPFAMVQRVRVIATPMRWDEIIFLIFFDILWKIYSESQFEGNFEERARHYVGSVTMRRAENENHENFVSFLFCLHRRFTIHIDCVTRLRRSWLCCSPGSSSQLTKGENGAVVEQLKKMKKVFQKKKREKKNFVTT